MPMARIKANERHEIDGEAEQGHGGKGADDGDGDSGCRHEHRPEILQKQHDHDQYQYPRLDERLVHRVNRLVNKNSRIVEGRVFESRRKRLAHLRHQTADFIRNLKGVGAGKGEDGNVRGFFAAEAREDCVLLLAQLDPADVLDAHDRGGWTGLGGLQGLAGCGGRWLGLDDDVIELFYIGHPAQSIDGKLKELVGGRRRPADLSRRDLNILVLDCVLNLQHRQPVGLELVRIQPDPHAVGSRRRRR